MRPVVTREEAELTRAIARTLPYRGFLHVPEEPPTVRELVFPYDVGTDETCPPPPPTERCPESPRVVERPIVVLFTL